MKMIKLQTSVRLLSNPIPLIFICVSIFIASTASENSEVEIPSIFGRVKLPNGNQLLGLKQSSFYTAQKFYEYRGIPYAEAPVGQLRFKAPIPYNEVWTQPRDASQYGSSCPQDDVLNEAEEPGHIEETVKPIGSEDCLFLNVAVPGKKPSSLNGFPVLVWIHGGSFQYEYGDAYGVRKLLEHEMIVVTFNHRLGALGFLNTGDAEIQGNMGLKDQVICLRWVRENIKAFGGNPDEVTLVGVNSGAVSAHLHMISPMSEGLFKQVILQSGTGISPWAFQTKPEKVAKRFYPWFYDECKNPQNENETLPLLDCFSSLDADSLIKKQQRMTEWFIDPLVPFGPSVETAGTEPKFLPTDPYKALKEGSYWAKDRVRLIAGVNSEEGLLHSWGILRIEDNGVMGEFKKNLVLLDADIAHHRMLNKVLTMEWQRALPITLSFRETAISIRNITDSIYNFYYRDEEDTNSHEVKPSKNRVKELKNREMLGANFHKFEEITAMYSDRNFFVPLHKVGELHGRSKEPVYLYWYDYKGPQSTTQFSGYNDTIYGAAHFDQIQFMFETPYFKEAEREEDIHFGRKFVGGIARFVQTGEPPAANWVSIDKAMLDGTVPFPYNRIGDNTRCSQIAEPFHEGVAFWDKLPLLEFGKTEADFPELMEAMKEEESKRTNDDEEVLPGVTRGDIEKLREKLEL